MRSFFASVAGLFFAGCSALIPPTGYHDMDATGGVTALPLGADRYKIEARGNGVTPARTVDKYAYLKAAEVTRDAGAKYFIILADANRDTVTTGSFGASATTHFVGNTAYTDVDEQTYHIPKAGRDFVIQVFRDNPPPGALLAGQVIIDNTKKNSGH